MLTSRFLLGALVATAAATFAAKPAHADVAVKVPFSFTVDGKQCPAGTYMVKRNAASYTVTLAGRDPAKVFTWVIVPTNSDGDRNKVVLQFDGQGSEHTLRAIRYGIDTTSRLDLHPQRTDESEDLVRGGR
ncbi:MAG TPA: hypothetical protein VL967_12120 [Terracidiphilus sp.]|nr:hypothetical protein [Terracidiphilus sp.]